ncbi:arginine decarboxylase [Salmonella sp. NCTC 11881]|nr:arginine decarboxylase [Salmonella sp. NCTC 11881]
MTDNDVVVLDRNCHKSIEQGLILTGAKPVYMVPSRNRYGIIGPIYPQEMQPETLQKKISASPLTKTKAGQKPSYSVVTNCTYDGVCYNAKEAQDLLAKNQRSHSLRRSMVRLCALQPDLLRSLRDARRARRP